MAHRAREHVHARRKRFEPVDPTQTARITEQFLTAAATGDTTGLLAMLAPDVTWTADSDGKASAIRTADRRRREGSRSDRRLLPPGATQADMRFETAVYNSAPAVVIYIGDRLEGVFLIEITDGKITNFYAMRNPDKLAGDRGPAHDQPLALCHAYRCGSSGSAIWAAPPRCCAPSPHGADRRGCRRPPR